jgi:DNA-binding Lrp family transcriptional regulator
MIDVNDLDRTDLRLLAELQKDASLSNLELADKVGIVTHTLRTSG